LLAIRIYPQMYTENHDCRKPKHAARSCLAALIARLGEHPMTCGGSFGDVLV
jgi:hypothetical protein